MNVCSHNRQGSFPALMRQETPPIDPSVHGFCSEVDEAALGIRGE